VALSSGFLTRAECLLIASDIATMAAAIKILAKRGSGPDAKLSGNEILMILDQDQARRKSLAPKIRQFTQAAQNSEYVFAPCLSRGAAYLSRYIDKVSFGIEDRHVDRFLFDFCKTHVFIKEKQSWPQIRLFDPDKDISLFAAAFSIGKKIKFFDPNKKNRVPIFRLQDLKPLALLHPVASANVAAAVVSRAEAYDRGLIANPFYDDNSTVYFSGLPVVTSNYAKCIAEVYGDKPMPPLPTRCISPGLPALQRDDKASILWHMYKSTIRTYRHGGQKGSNAITIAIITYLHELVRDVDILEFQRVRDLLAKFDLEGLLDINQENYADDGVWIPSERVFPSEKAADDDSDEDMADQIEAGAAD
jgi:hypothetical protein